MFLLELIIICWDHRVTVFRATSIYTCMFKCVKWKLDLKTWEFQKPKLGTLTSKKIIPIEDNYFGLER